MGNAVKFRYKRVLIIGCGGAGKSTLARKLGARFDLPVVHLDKLWWLPNWQSRTEEDFDRLLVEELNKDRWIIDGNFCRTLPMRLEYADFCIFLDYPTELCLKSVYERAREYKGKTRPDITEGCCETVDEEFEEWIRSFRESVRPEMLQALKNGSVPYTVFSSREETDDWFNCLCAE